VPCIGRCGMHPSLRNIDLEVQRAACYCYDDDDDDCWSTTTSWRILLSLRLIGCQRALAAVILTMSSRSRIVLHYYVAVVAMD